MGTSTGPQEQLQPAGHHDRALLNVAVQLETAAKLGEARGFQLGWQACADFYGLEQRESPPIRQGRRRRHLRVIPGPGSLALTPIAMAVGLRGVLVAKHTVAAVATLAAATVAVSAGTAVLSPGTLPDGHPAAPVPARTSAAARLVTPGASHRSGVLAPGPASAASQKAAAEPAPRAVSPVTSSSAVAATAPPAPSAALASPATPAIAGSHGGWASSWGGQPGRHRRKKPPGRQKGGRLPDG